jgi:hypothetical protein
MTLAWPPTLPFPDIQVHDAKKEIHRIFKSSSEVQLLTNEGSVKAWVVAAVTVFCPMDFGNYPRDSHTCPFLIGSRSSDDDDAFKVLRPRLTKRYFALNALSFHVTFSEFAVIKREFLGGNYSAAGFNVHLMRLTTPFLLDVYMPSAILVTASWISFAIPVENVPGRMSLLVTVLLMLLNISATVGAKSPLIKELTFMDAWMLTCIVFVSASLFEYAFQLKMMMGRAAIGPSTEIGTTNWAEFVNLPDNERNLNKKIPNLEVIKKWPLSQVTKTSPNEQIF